MNIRLFFCALLVLSVLGASGKDITLSNDPVQIALPVNREIRIEFPEAVIDLNVPAAVGERLHALLPLPPPVTSSSSTCTPRRLARTTRPCTAC